MEDMIASAVLYGSILRGKNEGLLRVNVRDKIMKWEIRERSFL